MNGPCNVMLRRADNVKTQLKTRVHNVLEQIEA